MSEARELAAKSAYSALDQAFESQSPEAIRALALTIDRARSPELWARLRGHHDLEDAAVATTAFELQAGVVAYEQGVFAWNSNERYFVRPHPAVIHPNLGPADHWIRLKRGRLESPGMWPFRDDATIADYGGWLLPRWWSHGLVHSLVGFAWWPDLTEMDVLHTARFAESFAAWHWYWLCDLGRDYCPQHRGQLGGTEYGRCPACSALDQQTPDAAVRAARIESRFGEWLSWSGLAFMRNEIGALHSGLEHGALMVPPPGTSLGLAEAADYAVWHHRRLRSSAFRRWLEHCAEPGRDYADSPTALVKHVHALLERLLVWREPTGPAWARRARRVLQDVGYRLCMAAARAGDETRHTEALEAVGGAVRSLGSDPAEDVSEALLAETLALCVESWEREAPPEERAEVRVFALGYRPTARPESEPAAVRRARAGGVERVLRSRGVPRPLLALAEVALAGPRRPSDPLADMLERFDPQRGVGWLALITWWRAVDWLSNQDPSHVWEVGWAFRYSAKRPPDRAEWEAYRLSHNPLVHPIFGVFEREWLLGLLRDEEVGPPRLAGGSGDAPLLLVGVDLGGPLVVPVTEELGRIWQLAAEHPTLAELAAETSDAAVAAAIECNAFVCVWDRAYDRELETPPMVTAEVERPFMD